MTWRATQSLSAHWGDVEDEPDRVIAARVQSPGGQHLDRGPHCRALIWAILTYIKSMA